MKLLTKIKSFFKIYEKFYVKHGFKHYSIGTFGGFDKNGDFILKISDNHYIYTDKKYVFMTFEDQYVTPAGDNEQADVFYYVKYEDPLLRDYVRRAFDITDMLDYGKFDIRIDASGRYYFIDSNANPAFAPKEIGTAMGFVAQGLYNVSFTDILRRIINNTINPIENGQTANGEHSDDTCDNAETNGETI